MKTTKKNYFKTAINSNATEIDQRNSKYLLTGEKEAAPEKTLFEDGLSTGHRELAKVQSILC